jgi:hypothetical protein
LWYFVAVVDALIDLGFVRFPARPPLLPGYCITNYFENGGTLEVAQRFADHSRRTKLYDRRGQKVLLEDIERIRYSSQVTMSKHFKVNLAAPKTRREIWKSIPTLYRCFLHTCGMFQRKSSGSAKRHPKSGLNGVQTV